MSAARGDINLGFCQNCSHIYNYAFNPELVDYSYRYENALHFSPRFQNYARGLAEELVDRFSLQHKSLVSIGGGDGAFLGLLCELGDNTGVCFDPGTDPEQFYGVSTTKRTRLINDTYSSKYANVPVDFVACRHVLEHIASPGKFMRELSETLKKNEEVNLYFEVPNVRFNLSENGLWDLMYEHCSYFGANSLKTLFRLSGFTVLGVEERYEGQFLTITASRNSKRTSVPDSEHPEATDVSMRVRDFQPRYKKVLNRWRHRLAEWQRIGFKVVVWGVGSKGVSFLNGLETQQQIEYVVDINPRKHGMHVVGTGQEVKSPEFLKKYQPDVVVITNHAYQQEIEQSLKALGVHSELVSL